MIIIMTSCFWLAAILLPAVVSSCSENQIEKCNALQKTANAHPASTFQALGDPEFSQLCREADQYGVCVGKFYSGCERAVQITLDGVLDALKYMCNDGKQTYLKHHQCFAGEELNTEGKDCVDKVTASSAEVSSRFQYRFGITQKEKNQALDDLCRATDEFKSCIRQVVSKHCGDEAADFEVEVLSKAVKPAEALGGCSPTSFRHMKWVFIGVGVVVAILLGFVIRVIIIKARKRPTGGDFNNPLQGAFTNRTV